MIQFSPYQIKPGSTFRLSDVDPDDKTQFNVSKSEGKKLLPSLGARLVDLHRMLYAQGKHRVLIVVQTIDAGGKDGTIREVFSPLDPAHFHVASFKAPSSLELSHDYLWRIHRELPRKGEIVVFNRSHYEDIVAVRVRGIYPKTVWEKRYQHLIDFERMLSDEGTLILKFFLCISKEEQLARFRKRVDRPDKRWKFNPADLEDRARWDEFMQAYEDVINRTNSEFAPWFVIPANRKWHRNLVVADAVGNALESLGMHYPEPDFDPAQFADIE
ncbi:MAG: PPK2 family polyphosphate kinase [Verrucomicrobiota bacterium]